MAIQSDEPSTEWFNVFSSYDCLIRVVARMYRFVNRCRHHHDNYPEYLTRFELDHAIRIVVTESQRRYFSSLQQELLSLNRRISSKSLTRLCNCLL